MKTFNVPFTGVQETLLLTLATRAMDNRSKRPILGDKKAEEIAQQLDYDFQKLKIPQKESFGGAIRARMLDDCTAEYLADHPDATVLDLGCGLDSRRERVKPPKSVRWFDIDYPDVIEMRRHFYTEDAGYQMIGASLTSPHCLDAIPTDYPAIIVADGLLPFLTENEITQLFRRLTAHFPGGQLAFNGYTKLASRLIVSHPSIKAIGMKPANPGFDDPHEPERWDPLLKLIGTSSIVGSPYVARTPWAYRATCRLMYSLPALRKEGGWIFRYQF
ncbi:putative polyketide synthase protein [Ktedonospora formicarum]|uniref:Putative polyketide synthase protein n=2 Tax=Ktedonospora formicarum TaxID=2778364 RepID=A0A8J3HZJ2_9CHLR|nr:putative polyketide synthase protein [Ktedonospora formicarum]